ncbi:MAG TPA: type III pantothenate kinase [Bacteroidales bacterium]|nr:type III pantothenate kinase [Bacteroidales bacterium]
MNLIIDIGNNSVKSAFIRDGQIVESGRHASTDEIAGFLENECSRFEKTIISTVVDITAAFTERISKMTSYLHLLSHKSFFPFSVDYDTPETLGMDRLAAVAWAYNKYRNGNVLVIDAGSAITFDLLTGGRYTGGTISPGMQMRFRALNSFTGRLPLVSPDRNVEFPARSTTDAINSGVIKGIVYEINEYICKFEKEYSQPMVLLTGGDAGFLADKLRGNAVVDTDLVTKGLNYILEYNADKEV